MPSKEKKKVEEYNPPAMFENVNESTVHLPANNQARQRPTLEQTITDPKLLQGIDDGSREEHYDLPDDYQNLDELKAPSLVESPETEGPRGYLEDCRSSTAPCKRGKSHECQTDGQLVHGYGQTASPTSSDIIPEKPKPSTQHQQVSRFATELYTVSYLIFFSILGTLARLGLQALTIYPGAPVQTGVLWANVGGSLIMGFLAEDRKLFGSWSPCSIQPSQQQHTPNGEERPPSASTHKEQHAALKKTIPLYIGLSTGFCGSFTSFSSFIRDAFLALANALPVPVSHTSTTPIDPASTVHRNGGYSLMALLAVIITTVSLSLSALAVGAHLALAVERYTPSITYIFARRFVDRFIVLLAWGCWFGAVLMAIWPPDREGGPAYTGKERECWRGQVLFATVFAPLGCLLRFYISLRLNSRIASFPLGTFAINMLGTAMEGMFYDLQHSQLRGGGVGGGMVGCQVLQGLMDGFCGAATTVSTWVVEVRALRRGHAWVYGSLSVGVGVGVMVGVMGGVLWGRGWEPPVCG
ncbi:MAG: hypothetical protein Q9181_002828 [Wetmoreana brouardii]